MPRLAPARYHAAMDATSDREARAGREFLKSGWERLGAIRSDQQRGLPCPEPEPPCPDGAGRVALPPIASLRPEGVAVAEALARRRSRRRYASTPLAIEELSFLLHAVGGVTGKRDRTALRAAPSAGARHALELSVAAFRVQGLERALWRYLPLEHALCRVSAPADLEERVTAALHGQGWGCAAVFVWTAVPYRMEWRYSVCSPKLILLDAGHACENLYLACECVGSGACAIGAYDQEALDSVVGVDGVDELAVYAATVGKL